MADQPDDELDDLGACRPDAAAIARMACNVASVAAIPWETCAAWAARFYA